MLLLNTVPPRSRLYGLVPREVGTIWVESLTSYLNRLGWRHGISPRALVAQEIVPHLSNDYPLHHLAAFRPSVTQAVMKCKVGGNSRWT